MKKNTVLIFLLSLCTIIGCRKFSEVPAPPTALSSGNVFTSNATAIAAVTANYVTLGNSGNFYTGNGVLAINLFPALSADELTLTQGVIDPNYYDYYKNSLVNNLNINIWMPLYQQIYTCNFQIEQLTGNKNLTAQVDQQLLGEAKFYRAFLYFYLVNLYGDVPMPLSSDYKVNSVLAKTPKNDVYKQIIADLNDAQNLLSSSYLDGTLLKTTTDRVRPTKWAATALLARAYLYTQNYSGARDQASALINNTTSFRLNPISSTYLRASASSLEGIWQLQPVTIGDNTQDALTFVLSSVGPSAGSIQQYYLSPQLLNAFEPNDKRLVNWVSSVTVNGTNYYYANKYKVNLPNQPLTEFENIFRLGEQYLIRAESQAQLGNITDAQSDLNMIRARAGLPNTTANSQSSLLAAIMHERQVELFTEWGHRWLDLKRTGTIDAVMGGPNGACVAKGGTWNPNQQLYPIPLTELQADPFLKQNAGY